MTLFRRYLVVTLFALWLGGFTFYASVVVPIGTDRLGRVGQGFITRLVTVWLNVIGLVALLPMLWDAWAGAPNRRARWLRFTVWLVMAGALAVLWALHGSLSDRLDDATSLVRDRPEFLGLHKVYLWVSSAQWAAGLAYLALALCDWRRVDQSNGSQAATSAAAASTAVGPA